MSASKSSRSSHDGKAIKITLVKSGICCPAKHKRIITALGLGKRGRSITRIDSPEVRGMVAEISYLLDVEPVSIEEHQDRAKRYARK